MKGFYLSFGLVEDDAILLQCGDDLLLIDAYAFIELSADLLVDVCHQFGGTLHALFIALCHTAGYGLVVGHSNLVELFQV